MTAPATVGATTTRLHQVFCVIDTLHRDLATADLAVAGQFVHAGRTLTLGRRPDWLTGGLDDDEEWRIEWVKSYEGLDLGHAYARTGDPRYLETWQDLVTSFCEQVPVGHDTSDVSARRLQNWVYAWQRFADAPGFPGLRPGLARSLVDRLIADTEHLAANLTPERNHRTLELYTLLLVGLALDDRRRAAEALALLADNAATDVWPDGVHRECSSDYHCIVLRSFVGAIAAARAAGLAVPETLVSQTDAAATVAMHLQRPDGSMPALSDGDQGDFRALLALAAEVLGRTDLRWVATLGLEGAAPAERHATFTVGGYVVQRSGWGERRPFGDEAWAVLDCGPIGDGGHGHYDQLNVELYARGRVLVVDPGRYTYADGPDGWRHWFKGTAAHNTVTVDGHDQIPYRRGKPKGPLAAARLLRRVSGGGTDTIVAEATSPNHDAVHTRTVTLFEGEPRWLIRDELDAPSMHRYDLRWHLTPDAAGRTTVTAVGDTAVVTAPGLTLSLPGLAGAVTIEAGWVSPSYGIKHPAPVVVATVRGDRVGFVTEVVPT